MWPLYLPPKRPVVLRVRHLAVPDDVRAVERHAPAVGEVGEAELRGRRGTRPPCQRPRPAQPSCSIPIACRFRPAVPSVPGDVPRPARAARPGRAARRRSAPTRGRGRVCRRPHGSRTPALRVVDHDRRRSSSRSSCDSVMFGESRTSTRSARPRHAGRRADERRRRAAAHERQMTPDETPRPSAAGVLAQPFGQDCPPSEGGSSGFRAQRRLGDRRSRSTGRSPSAGVHALANAVRLLLPELRRHR